MIFSDIKFKLRFKLFVIDILILLTTDQTYKASLINLTNHL